MKEIDFAGVWLAENVDETAVRPLSQSQRELFLTWLCEQGVWIKDENTAGRLSDAEAYYKVFELFHLSIQLLMEDQGDLGLKH